MRQSTDTYHTAKHLSSEELQQYRSRLERHFQNRQVEEALWQRAWRTAHRIAAMLYKDFGATDVAVFGSLAKRESFTKWSDIDIAVWGIRSEEYLQAVWEAEAISGLFKVDLVDFESCTDQFRERVINQAVSIGKGAIYDMDWNPLIQRISDERSKIGKSVEKIAGRLEKIKVAPVEYREEIGIAIAKELVDCYRGMENIFKRIALDVDLRLPDGSMWDKELLAQMAEPRAERPAVISENTFALLQELLAFRHVFNNIYGEELIYERTEQNAKRIGDLFATVSEELDGFIAYLIG